MRPIRTAPAVLAVASALALAACGSSSPADPAASGAPSPAQRTEAALDFSKCMREHGIKNFPNPKTGPGGSSSLEVKGSGPGGLNVPQHTMEAAQRACAHYQEELAPKLTPQQKVEREEALQKFAHCMREHGIHVEIHASGGAIGIAVRAPGTPGANQSGPNPASPAFRTAQETCSKDLPFKKGARFAAPPPGGTKGSGSEGSEHHQSSSLSVGG